MPPHHWVGIKAKHKDKTLPGGQAGLLPDGDLAFWTTLDMNTDNTFKFYTYWQEMRSWKCANGTTDPACSGYNGQNGGGDYYGNLFDPAKQTPMTKGEWVCVEMMLKGNTPGEYDGAQAYWIDGKLVGDYSTGSVRGRWLRQNFYTHGDYYKDEQAFEGYNFRNSTDIKIYRVALSWYFKKTLLMKKKRRALKLSKTKCLFMTMSQWPNKELVAKNKYINSN